MQLAFHSNRKNCEDSYKQIFKSQKPLSKIQDSTNNSEKSRLSKSPRSYRNIDIESYFLQSIYVPYAESLLGQMSERFEDQKNEMPKSLEFDTKIHRVTDIFGDNL